MYKIFKFYILTFLIFFSTVSVSQNKFNYLQQDSVLIKLKSDIILAQNDTNFERLKKASIAIYEYYENKGYYPIDFKNTIILVDDFKEIKTLRLNKKKTYQALGVLLFLLIVLTIFLFYSRNKLKHINNLLATKNHEIATQKEEIALQNDKITTKALELLVLNRSLREEDRLHEGLTNMIVHDLKNPISNIIDISENKEVVYFAKEILTMVENILDVKKYEGMVLPLNKNKYSLKKVSESAIKQIELFAEHKNIKIKNLLHEDLFVNIDQDIIRRVIVNLLSNSIKYSSNNGSIILDFEISEKNTESIIVKVIDYGIGIKKDKIDLIFNKFSQIVAKKTGLARSTGLGLTFCKMAVEAHGGKILVRSESQKQTIFSFNLNLVEEKTKTTETNDGSNKNPIINLEKKDKQYLLEFNKKLVKLKVYEISKIRKITNKIDTNFSENVKKWKFELNKSVFNCNTELYKKITNKLNN